MKNRLLKWGTFLAIALIGVISLARVSMPPNKIDVKQVAPKKSLVKKSQPTYRPYRDPATLRKPYDWRRSSEVRAYPKIKRIENDLTIRVSLKGNRVYILRNNERIYTMLASGGLFKKSKSLTPLGTFKIQGGRGDAFYNPNLNEGANNWTSWDEQNVYLFHSVPTKNNGKYNLTQARKLGKEPASHGCIRLSVADSLWLKDNIPTGTKVIIKNE
ncbi:L,D-transpeptidase [Lactobacillus sp. ESL0681]|uniref:L,D-transpeptidase n=1 Tax=Lactobacillus sp. ESL0681 TaxID=2983211 RepID=UPI0023F669C5|nr:L,D-transpeptidase [Lactobacillus sp. ESL0681]WEV40980.1 L,D-transpeptidase [Lactobacillus sp. ESL0681]